MKILKYNLITISIILSLLFFGCSKNNNDNQNSLDPLIKEVLDASCDDNIRQSMQNEINWQRQHLTDEQMRMSLQNMLGNMQCS